VRPLCLFNDECWGEATVKVRLCIETFCSVITTKHDTITYRNRLIMLLRKSINNIIVRLLHNHIFFLIHCNFLETNQQFSEYSVICMSYSVRHCLSVRLLIWKQPKIKSTLSLTKSFQSTFRSTPSLVYEIASGGRVKKMNICSAALGSCYTQVKTSLAVLWWSQYTGKEVSSQVPRWITAQVSSRIWRLKKIY